MLQIVYPNISRHIIMKHERKLPSVQAAATCVVAVPKEALAMPQREMSNIYDGRRETGVAVR